MAFFLDDDLRQDGVRDIVARLRIQHVEIDVLADHLGEVVERDVAAGVGVVEAPVGVFLDNDGFALGAPLGHSFMLPICAMQED